MSRYLKDIGEFDIVETASLTQATELLTELSGQISVAICDLNLPDAPGGQIVDVVRSFEIPTVVLTATVDEKTQADMRQKQVIDYVVKRTITEIEHLAHVVARLCYNKDIKVLLVDDSSSYRAYLMNLLKRYCYQIFVANNGHQALNKLKEHPDITLVVTDYEMPDMDGQALIQKIRETYTREELAIIGVSSASDSGLTARILKSGANDFINKPFEEEEFYCRVTQNTNLISYVRQIKNTSVRDFLTGLYNRRHLFQAGNEMHRRAQRGDTLLCAALLDADYFKRINDEYGHQVGDEALIALAKALDSSLPESALLARYGGEEFACLTEIFSTDDAYSVFEKVRQTIEDIELCANGHKIPITASIGVTTSLGASLEAMLAQADECVYRAKEAGRNRVVVA